MKFRDAGGTDAARRRPAALLPLLAGTAAAILLSMSQGARAASATTTFNVTATVLTSCSVTASDLAFGTYSATTATDATATSTVTVTCSLLTPYTISLNTGSNASGSTRRMGSGSSRLTYELYRDSAMTNVWGTAANSMAVSGTGTGLAAATTVYGKIPKTQAVVPGSYTDQITVTVDY